ncbi:MAG TPA: hypothetical protein VMH24_01275 [Candidatus Sulfotelmatobacter sp.]|nr:hypothetical protein [Candidatus Sulfotelmatobacter sp.]
MAFEPAAWSEFAAAVVAAAAALAGLIFVALSINLDRIIALGGVAELAAQGIIVLTAVLVAAIVVLVPGQDAAVLGVELAAVGAIQLVLVAHLSRMAYQATAPEYHGKRIQTFLFNSVSGALGLVAGVSLLAGAGGGLYWLVPSWLIGTMAGIANGWILLVEIKR